MYQDMLILQRGRREWDVMWDSHLCGRGRYGFRAGELDISPVRGIGNTHTRLHSYGYSIHISGFTFAFIDDDSRV